MEVVVRREGKVVARVRPDQRRPDVAYTLNDRRMRESGFGVVLPIQNESDAGLGNMRVFAVMRSGDERELFLPSVADAEPRTSGVGGREDRGARAPEPGGAIEAAAVERPLELTLPADASTYRWLEVRTGEPLQEGVFELADRLEESPLGPRMISFKTLARRETSVRLRVGACNQWHGYRTNVVYLMPSPAQDIREIRLLR